MYTPGTTFFSRRPRCSSAHRLALESCHLHEFRANPDTRAKNYTHFDMIQEKGKVQEPVWCRTWQLAEVANPPRRGPDA